MKHNTISHIEIPAPDLAKAIAFYSAIFNWTIEIVAENSYAYFRIGDTQTGGGFDASLTPAAEKQGCQVVVDVDSIETTIDQITKAGGSITLPKTEIPGGHGFYAGFRDTNGNHLQIHARE